MRQTAAVRHDFDLHDVARADTFPLAESEHGGDRRVGTAAAGKLLEAHGLAGDFQRIAPVLEDLVGGIVAGAIEGQTWPTTPMRSSAPRSA
jgi:hypothetical protein